MAELLTFRFRTPSLNDWTVATVVNPDPAATPPVVGSLSILGMTCPYPKIGALRQAARELLDQPVDGTTGTKNTIDGTTIDLFLAADRSTLQFDDAGSPMPVAKAEEFLAGLVQFSLLPPLP